MSGARSDFPVQADGGSSLDTGDDQIYCVQNDEPMLDIMNDMTIWPLAKPDASSCGGMPEASRRSPGSSGIATACGKLPQGWEVCVAEAGSPPAVHLTSPTRGST